MVKSPIKPNILISLTSLFQRKNWEVNDGTVSELSLFDKFCERLKLFTVEEQEMIIEITEDFCRIGINNYLSNFFESLILLGDDFFDAHEKIYILPLVDPFVRSKKSSAKLHRGKTKSAHFLHYYLEASDWRWLSPKLIPHISFKKLVDSFNPDDSCIVLIDDFVGTGQTAEEVCRIFLQEEFKVGKLSPEKIKVVTIAAQKRGISHLKDKLNIDIVSNIIIAKGITDKYAEPELAIKNAQMANVENILNISPDFQFGHGRSEAMITFLNKTPNNTFPVYWDETKTRVAPFPRYKNFNV